jgi:hypothetical protein
MSWVDAGLGVGDSRKGDRAVVAARGGVGAASRARWWWGTPRWAGGAVPGRGPGGARTSPWSCCPGSAGARAVLGHASDVRSGDVCLDLGGAYHVRVMLPTALMWRIEQRPDAEETA